MKNLRQDLEINKYKDEAAKPTTSISEVQCMKNLNQEIKKTKDRVNVDVISSQLYLFLHLIEVVMGDRDEWRKMTMDELLKMRGLESPSL